MAVKVVDASVLAALAITFDERLAWASRDGAR